MIKTETVYGQIPMKTKCGLDAVIKHTDNENHHGLISNTVFATWIKETGVCIKPMGNSAFDLVVNQKKPKYKLPNKSNKYYNFAVYRA